MLWSEHFSGKEYNETHKGIGISYDTGEYIYSALTYRNSYDRDTIALTLGDRWYEKGEFSIAGHAGYVTGYSDVIGGFVTFRYKNIIVYSVPGVVTALGFTWRLR
jgi:hypothetical protein